MADLGFFLLFLCCLMSCYTFLASLGAARWRHRRLYSSAKYAVTITAVMSWSAAIILWYLLYQRDYSVGYIWKNSSNDLPIMYTFTAFWSSLEGSHFLWTLLIATFTTIALWTGAKNNEHIMPYVAASLSAVSAWMFYLLVSYSDPFVRMFPAGVNGQGMNTLLQNPYMAIHPPTLFTGYTALAIPAAYSVAALCYGDITEGWLKTTRRWTLFAWIALTAGIFLGGRWAYVELGWAGYWAWDPVENSSFLPWCFATALLHSLIVQDRLGHLKRLTLVLAFLGFFFSFFGTFITRSGVVSSVHSFAESPIGPNYLFFLGTMLLIVSILYGMRAYSIIPAETDKVWGVSKESSLIVTQFLVLTLATIVCVGTLYPIVSEAFTGERTSVQAPYFNVFAPWIGLGLIIAISIGNLMRFQTAKIPHAKLIMGGSAIIATPLAATFIYFGEVLANSKGFGLAAQLVGTYLVFWAISCLLFDFYFRLRDLRFNYRLFFQRNLGYFGALIAHIGLLVAITGFLGNYRGVERVATLKTGESIEFFGYTMAFEGIKVRPVDNYQLYEAVMNISRGGEKVTTMHPARSQYPTKQELLHEVGLFPRFWHDIYITLSDFDKETNAVATFEIHVNPTVKLVWTSVFMMVIGGIFALFDRYRGDRSRDVIRGV